MTRDPDDQLRDLLSRQPDHHQAHHELGIRLHQRGQNEQALVHLNRSVELAPDVDRYHFNLGYVLRRVGQTDRAIACFGRAIKINPNHAEAYNSLGNAYRELGRLEEAVLVYRRAVAIRGDYAVAFNNLGTALQDQTKLDEAIGAFERAIELDPDYRNAHSNLLLCLNYHDAYSPQQIFDAHRAFGERYETNAPLRIVARRDRIRIGYLSPDFRQHSVAFFIWPVLANHNMSRFEITCYSDVASPDVVTQHLSRLVDRWRPIAGVGDDDVATLIADDGIDILVELAGHTGANRLPMLGRRVAPIQVNYLGYPNTSGLATMDYRVTDAIADTVGATEPLHTERLVRLPHAFFCYMLPPGAPDVATLPAKTDGRVTFAVFANFAKVRPTAMKRWAEILLAVPNSRLLLQAKSLNDPGTRNAVSALFADERVSSDRIELRGWIDFQAYMALFNTVDIVLDTFPFAGHTTSCHAMWMGVPVVTLTGRTHRQRMGASLLTNLGLNELVARSEEDYVQIATELAGDLDHLARLRAGLRQRIQQSPIGDAIGFTRSLEEAYAQMVHGT